uniref:Uncharacterized protein n=1 Tax=Candidatus Kentrum sp. LPFa TaxID=2126335 RepID=A0A450WID2_9GAMM|nr:MAG: hypothetical protein BECKLPF1236A_GA0070988_101549 [Candidatus Kentron sp. LPFa]VFK23198.1 MAG: hypothetical protein BECKLPF1236C_GA0070990_100049 [Candidatus Kentron sp. LPFa]
MAPRWGETAPHGKKRGNSFQVVATCQLGRNSAKSNPTIQRMASFSSFDAPMSLEGIADPFRSIADGVDDDVGVEHVLQHYSGSLI